MLRLKFFISVFCYLNCFIIFTRFCFIMFTHTLCLHAFYKQPLTPGWNWQKIKQKLSNTLMLNFHYLKFTLFLHPHEHPKILGDILKKCTNSNCACFNEAIWLITMKMRLEMKNKSQRYDTNRPNTEAELKKSLAYKKSVYFSQFSSNFLEQTKERRI